MAPSVMVYEDPDAFLERARSFLELAPAEHNVILGIAAGLARGEAGYEGPPFFATVEDGGRVVGAAMRTPPHKLVITDLPGGAARPLAQAVHRRFDSLPAVLGSAGSGAELARAWAELAGVEVVSGMRQRIYRLDRVIPPEGVAGRLRTAHPADLPLVDRWAEGFAEDAGPQFRVAPERRAQWVEREELFLWEADAPVSMAVAQGAVAGGVRVGFVYTPPERRRRGYASACVAALSQRMLAGGCDFCMLYTDLANPTSNRIYQAIGYRPVADVQDFDFV